MRSLSPEEAELWARVAETIRPLSREPRVAPPTPAASVEPEAKRSSKPKPAPPPKQAPPPKARPGLASTLDGTWDRKLRSGDIIVDRTLDLHGYSLDGAWTAIERLLEQAIGQGDRVILLITGHARKGLITGHARKGEPPVQRGKIRAAVHDWLTASRHAPRIAAVRNAHPRHGGGGSLYIILRRG